MRQRREREEGEGAESRGGGEDWERENGEERERVQPIHRSGAYAFVHQEIHPRVTNAVVLCMHAGQVTVRQN